MNKTPRKILDKKNFHRIKTMKYDEMVRFIQNIYASGFEDGRADSTGLNEVDTKTVLMNVRGIGPKRASAIMDALNMKLDDEQMKYYPCGNCGKDLAFVKGTKFCPYCGSSLEWEE